MTEQLIHELNFTEEEDKKEETIHVRKALKRRGHPNWTLFRKEMKKTPQEKVERRGKVVLPLRESKDIQKVQHRDNPQTNNKEQRP